MQEQSQIMPAPSIGAKGHSPTEYRGLIASIISFVAREMRLAEHEVYGNHRARRPTLARFVVAWLAHGKHGRSFTLIGRVLNGRHHTTIWNSYHEVEARRAADPKFLAWTDDLRARAP